MYTLAKATEEKKRSNGLKSWSRFWFEQDAQATTEYILMLSIIIGVFIIAFKGWIGPTLSKFARRISDSIDNKLTKVDLHTLRF